MSVFLCQAEDGIRALVRSRGLGDVYKRQVPHEAEPDVDRRRDGPLPQPLEPRRVGEVVQRHQGDDAVRAQELDLLAVAREGLSLIHI